MYISYVRVCGCNRIFSPNHLLHGLNFVLPPLPLLLTGPSSQDFARGLLLLLDCISGCISQKSVCNFHTLVNCPDSFRLKLGPIIVVFKDAQGRSKCNLEQATRELAVRQRVQGLTSLRTFLTDYLASLFHLWLHFA
jgi:hypothetical protein